ncbi:SDR family NAD(P)-dependent oxidoreductase [Streptomyces anthocyanicus]|uniref:SDR family NAD(P)-dependent oxidoreductase n=1 Tax=Streptomyces anthocyanicus TaxID=68174 RepID=UPI002F91A386|nr:SDR family NAD(P)-dependent oxidoreductase [Streptomyces anthocyanicus]
MSSRPPAGLPHTRVALVTVADAGLGRAVARELAEAGMTVYVGARREKAGQKAERELRASGLDARHVPLDLDEDATMARAAELVERSSGRLDVLVNMVGLTSSLDGTSENSPDGFRAVFETNLLDAIHLMTVTNAMFPLLRRSGGGHIVNVASAFHAPARNGSGTPRNAVEALTLQYADIGRQDGVLVNAVCVDAGIPAWDGSEEDGALRRAAALTVRLVLAEDPLLTATSTGPDGVCSGLSAAAPGGESDADPVRVV